MTKEVLKQALEALEKTNRFILYGTHNEPIGQIAEQGIAAITAIKEALAQPEEGSLSNGFWVVEAVDTVLNAWPLSQESLLKIALGTEDVSLNRQHKNERTN